MGNVELAMGNVNSLTYAGQGGWKTGIPRGVGISRRRDCRLTPSRWNRTPAKMIV